MRFTVACAVAALFAVPAAAQPGLGQKVHGANLEPGVTEFEARYGRLTGGRDAGADALTLEAAHHFSKRLYGAVLLETGREPGQSREVGAIAIEGVVHLTRIEELGLDVALYGEYGFERHGPNTAEAKLLLQHKAGGFDGRINLIGEKTLSKGGRVKFGYGASADWRVAGDFRLGAAAFGEPESKEHFAGPIVKAELEHLPGRGELGIEAGYLFALGKARDDASGQARLLLEYEFHF